MSEALDFRWWLFRRTQAESHKMPPSRATFLECVKRVQYQYLIWKSIPDPNPAIQEPDKYGLKWDCNKFIPVMTTLPPAPETLLQQVKYGCSKSVCETFGVGAKLTVYIVTTCVAVEQKGTRVHVLLVINVLMTLNNYFHLDSDISLAVSTSRHNSSILSSEGSKLGRFYLVACERLIKLKQFSIACAIEVQWVACGGFCPNFHNICY